MVPGTRPTNKKAMPAASQQPPQKPTRLTRGMVAMLSLGANRYARRPPPRPTRTSMASRKASKTKAIHKAISSTS